MTDLKKLEREILEALGWRKGNNPGFMHSPDCDGSDCINVCHPDGPNLSDPGQFWPMFREWSKEHLKRGDWQLTWMLESGYHFSVIVEPKIAVEAESMESEAAAGIQAWHQALVEMGKRGSGEKG